MAEDEPPQVLPPVRLDGKMAEDEPPVKTADPARKARPPEPLDVPSGKTADPARKARPPEPLDAKTAAGELPFMGAYSVRQTPLPQAVAGKMTRGEPPYKEWTQPGRRGRQSNWSARSPLAARLRDPGAGPVCQWEARTTDTSYTASCGGRFFLKN